MESSNLLKTFDVMLTSIREKFAEIRKLSDMGENIAPQNEPYKNKYAAISILQDVESQLTVFIEANDVVIEESRDKALVMLASIHLRLGLLHTDTEEPKVGEELFSKCMEIIDGRELEPEVVPIALATLNQLGIVWSQWNQPLKAKNLLEKAERIYKDFTDNCKTNSCDPINILSHFGIDDGTDKRNPRKSLDELHTMTLYYLVQIYESIKDYSKSAMYCHKTLYRQIGDGKNLQDLDCVDWALNVATLSQYFVEKQFFSQARYHLAVAIYVLEKYEDILRIKESHNNTDTEMLAADWENYRHRRADVTRCWGKYGISLLCTSKQRLMHKVEKDDEIPESNGGDSKSSGSSTADSNSSELNVQVTANHLSVMKFRIPENYIEPIVNQVTSESLLDFTDAKKVFLNTQKWLEEAKVYYTLENHASDHVQIAQDLSQAFKYLTFFEENEDRQAQMHKRRIDILENVAKELNPQYYKPICRQIWIELGETYSDILDIKRERLRASNEEVTAYALAKINRLAKNAIRNFQSFLDSVDDNRRNIPDDILQPTLYAYFHLGTLYNKLMTSDKRTQLVNTENSVNAYRFVVDYCEKDPKAADIMKVELGLCTELVTLLALKADRLRLQVTIQ